MFGVSGGGRGLGKKPRGVVVGQPREAHRSPEALWKPLAGFGRG